MKLIIYTKNKNEYKIWNPEPPKNFAIKSLSLEEQINNYINYHIYYKRPTIVFNSINKIATVVTSEIESWTIIVRDDED